jgi:hypothetical protein
MNIEGPNGFERSNTRGRIDRGARAQRNSRTPARLLQTGLFVDLEPTKLVRTESEPRLLRSVCHSAR